MSVVGFDIGNENCAIAVAKRGGIDVLLNDESKRETPAVVSFGEKQRFLGSAGAAFAATNPKSTISQIKRLIGRLYKEPSLQEDLRLLPFETSESPLSGVLIRLEYLNMKYTFTPVEILGMLFSHLKQLTEKNLESPVVDCVIGIPSYFTDLQRREYLNAASIAGLRPLQLIHDCTAVALGYGMYKTDFSNKGPTNVMFLDIGQCDTQVTIAAFEKGRMTILSHSFDQHLGGRDFDEVLFRHFATQFKKQYDIDVYSNARASVRLRASCEKLKKVLSANADAPLSIECLIDDKDVTGFITRKEFENLSVDLLERVTDACCKAVKDSGLNAYKVHTIELVGSGSRVPAIMRRLSLFFNKEPMRTLNGSECVARGCALYCAMLSPTLRVPEYKIDPYQTFGAKNVKATVNVHLNVHGIIEIESASFLEVLNPFCDYSNWLTSAANHFFKNDVANHKPAGSSLSTAHYAVETRRRRARLQKLAVSENYAVLTTTDDLHQAQKRAQMFADQDIKVEQTKEKRNSLESFIYDTRSKFLKYYRSVATDSEVEIMSKSLQDNVDWLYEEGDDESEQVYISKLEDLKKLLDPMENRYKDEKAKKEATKALQTCIQENRLAADILPSNQQNEVNNECVQAEEWLSRLSQFQDSLGKDATRIYYLSAITEITQAFKRRCEVIMRSKPSFPKYDDPVAKF